jgi:hypothetical protein
MDGAAAATHDVLTAVLAALEEQPWPGPADQVGVAARGLVFGWEGGLHGLTAPYWEAALALQWPAVRCLAAQTGYARVSAAVAAGIAAVSHVGITSDHATSLAYICVRLVASERAAAAQRGRLLRALLEELCHDATRLRPTGATLLMVGRRPGQGGHRASDWH